MYKAFENLKPATDVFFELAKAFDTVDQYTAVENCGMQIIFFI